MGLRDECRPAARRDVAVVLGGVDGVGDAFERAQGAVDGRGDGGGEIMCNSFGGKKAADAVEGLGRAFHRIVAGGAVDVDVEEGGGERGVFVRPGSPDSMLAMVPSPMDRDAGVVEDCRRR